MEKNKIIYIVIVAALVIVVIGGIIYWQKQGNIVSPQNQNTPTANENIQNNATEPNTPSSNNNAAPSTKILTYANALKTYASRRIQFSVNSSNYCTMTPSTGLAFKKGTNIMLDNRYKKPLTIYLDGKAYYMSAYGFKIVTLTTTAPLPHTIRVDCGTGKNNGSILLEK